MLNKDSELLLSIPQRGIKILPPQGMEWLVEKGKNREKIPPLTEKEKAKLWLILYSNILKSRYPTKEKGQQFMEYVDYARRQDLLAIAQTLASYIYYEWNQINPSREIAIILFGSIARGLVKSPSHPDPSNIDLTVIGDINDQEKDLLFDAIRDHRTIATNFIINSCSDLPSDFDIHKAGNAGVCIQHTNKLKINGYSSALELIKANAIALHDPTNIWAQIEDEALETVISNGFLKKTRAHKRHKVL